MKIQPIDSNGLDKSFEISVPAQEINEKILNKLQELVKVVKVPGFRPGKVPIEHVQRKYTSHVRNEVIEEVVKNAVQSATNNLSIFDSPTIDNFKSSEEDGVTFLLKVELQPRITIPKFKEIQIEKPKLEISEGDIDEELKKLILKHKTFTDIRDGAAQYGDQTTISLEGYYNNKTFPGSKGENIELEIGANSFIKEVEDAVIGKRAGENFSVDVSYPKDYKHKDFAGKTITFEVTINSVKSPTIHEVNEEFAKKLGCKDVEEIRDKIKQGIEKFHEEDVLNVMKASLFRALNQLLTYDVPQSLLNIEMERLRADKSLIEEADAMQKTEEEKEEMMHNIALRRVKVGLLLIEYAKNQNINVSQNELRVAMIQNAKMFPGQENKILKLYQQNREMLTQLQNSILEGKTVRAILDHEVHIIEKPCSTEELNSMLENIVTSLIY